MFFSILMAFVFLISFVFKIVDFCREVAHSEEPWWGIMAILRAIACLALMIVFIVRACIY